MGTFSVSVGIGNPGGGDLHWVDALVDTGAIHSMIPESLLEQTLHVPRIHNLEFELADGTVKTYGYGVARFRLEDREMPCPVIFGPEDEYLLGATTLESFNLIPDTSHLRLVPAPRMRARSV